MMYLSADLEGLPGFRSGREEEKNQAILLQHLQAATNGIHKACGTNILAKSFHGAIHGTPPPFVETIVGSGGENFDLPGIDSTFQGLFLLGFHGVEGKGVHGHAYRWPCIFLNGQRIGEITVQIYRAAQFNVPTLFFAGDRHGLEEAQSLIPDLPALCLRNGNEAEESPFEPDHLVQLETACNLAAKRTAKSLPLPENFLLEVPLRTKAEADMAEKLPYLIQRTGTTIGCRFPRFPDAYHFLMVDLWDACHRARRP